MPLPLLHFSWKLNFYWFSITISFLKSMLYLSRVFRSIYYRLRIWISVTRGKSICATVLLNVQCDTDAWASNVSMFCMLRVQLLLVPQLFPMQKSVIAQTTSLNGLGAFYAGTEYTVKFGCHTVDKQLSIQPSYVMMLLIWKWIHRIGSCAQMQCGIHREHCLLDAFQRVSPFQTPTSK